MAQFSPTVLALDFDGVLCDGLLEYFQVSWRTYCQVWSPADITPPEHLAETFYQLRPVIEIGWEMPLLLRALLTGVPPTTIVAAWSTVAKELLVAEQIQPTQLGITLDRTRDAWIESDLTGWLALHQFYPGIIARLAEWQGGSTYPVIVTTKEGRFVRQLLQQQGIELAESQILGKEAQRPKSQLLRELAAVHCQPGSLGTGIWFVEDRLKTLQAVQQQADLAGVRLFLAAWGYNTPLDHQLTAQDDRLHLLSLHQFAQDFSEWE